MFKSSLDVGSYFIDVQPEDRIEFRNKQDRSGFEAQIFLDNVTNGKANVVYFVSENVNSKIWTSNTTMKFEIKPRYGFLKKGEHLYSKITATGGTQEDLEKGLFFVKSLPLSDDYNVKISLFIL